LCFPLQELRAFQALEKQMIEEKAKRVGGRWQGVMQGADPGSILLLCRNQGVTGNHPEVGQTAVAWYVA
jgi:hypothetical protein